MVGTWLFAQSPRDEPAIYSLFAVPYLLASYWVATALYVGLASRWASDDAREWWARAGAYALEVIGAWVLIGTAVLYGPEWFLYGGKEAAGALAALGGVSGIVAVLGGFYGKSGMREGRGTTSPLRARIMQSLLPVCTTAFGILLIVILSLCSSLLLVRFELWMQGLHVETVNKAQVTVDYETHELGKLLEYEHELKNSPSFERGLEGPLSHSMMEEVKGIGRDVLRRVRGMLHGLDTRLQMLREEHAATIPLRVEDSAIPITVAGPSTEYKPLREAVSYPRIFWCVFLAFLALVILASALSWLFGVNRFSLHSLYGNRLVRAYPGASNPNRLVMNPGPTLNLFTNFDRYDNIGLKYLVPAMPGRLFHVINATLNLGKTQELAWQQRQGASFTMSPLHVGSHVTHFRRVENYGTDDEGLTLGRAMTASGAAVSPALGYHSSRPVALALTFFNARLGWWLPNPKAGLDVWRKPEPSSIRPLVTELVGATNDESKFVYVSDGGHFENLGLYEMIRRRCRLIVVVDATCDDTFQYQDLAIALRLIRVDFSIRIEFPCDSGPTQHRTPTRHFTSGRIRYSDVDEGNPDDVDGVIIYITQ